jgi:predicted anti-sigma-YlaC factor YlaD
MCERAHEWASLRLDGELSEFERVLLDSHLRRCGSCAAYVREISLITEAIRGAELIPLPEPIHLPLRRRIAYAGRALQAGAATAAVIAATVGLSAQWGSTGQHSANGLADSVRLSASSIGSGPNTESDALLRAPRLANLKAQQGVGHQRGLRIDS